MKKRLLSWLGYCLALFAVVLAACSRLNLPEPQAPDATPSAAQLTAARNWFAQLVPATAKPVTLNWSNAHALDGWLLVPLADTSNPFTAEHKRAYRYLIARNTTGTAFTGQLVEAVLEGQTSIASSVEQAIVAATQQLRAAPQAPAPLPGVTGLLLFYSPAYHYETGFVYRQGQPLAERVRFLHSAQTTAPAAPPVKGSTPQGAIDNPGTSDCIMELRCGYTGEYEYLSNCIYVAHCYASPGGGGDGGGWGGDGGGGGSTPTQPTQTNTIDQSKLQPCQAQVLQNLQAANGTALLGIVKLFSGTEPGYNWVVKDGALDNDTYGLTSSLYDISNRSVTTTFNASKWGNASDLSIARTMLHESIHAYLVAYFAVNPKYALSPNATFGDMVTAYNTASMSTPQPDLNVIHHNEMAQGGSDNGWIGDIAWSLREYGIKKGYNLSNQFYMDMAWGGLTETSAFLTLPLADRIRILNTVQVELTGKDINANSSQQSGNNGGC